MPPQQQHTPRTSAEWRERIAGFEAEITKAEARLHDLEATAAKVELAALLDQPGAADEAAQRRDAVRRTEIEIEGRRRGLGLAHAELDKALAADEVRELDRRTFQAKNLARERLALARQIDSALAQLARLVDELFKNARSLEAFHDITRVSPAWLYSAFNAPGAIGAVPGGAGLLKFLGLDGAPPDRRRSFAANEAHRWSFALSKTTQIEELEARRDALAAEVEADRPDLLPNACKDSPDEIERKGEELKALVEARLAHA